MAENAYAGKKPLIDNGLCYVSTVSVKLTKRRHKEDSYLYTICGYSNWLCLQLCLSHEWTLFHSLLLITRHAARVISPFIVILQTLQEHLRRIKSFLSTVSWLKLTSSLQMYIIERKGDESNAINRNTFHSCCFYLGHSSAVPEYH